MENKRKLVDRSLDVGAPPPTSKVTLILIAICLLLVIGGIATWLVIGQQRQERLEKISILSTQADKALAEKDWAKAEDLYSKIKIIDSKSEAAASGIQKLEQTKKEELARVIDGQLALVSAAASEKDWKQVLTYTEALLELDAKNLKAKDFQEKALDELRKAKVDLFSNDIKTAINERDIKAAEKSISLLRKIDNSNEILSDYQRQLAELKEQIAEDKRQAGKLYLQARALDNGKFSKEALVLLNEAKRLDPDSILVQKLYEKMSSYISELQVPSDYPTISAAIEVARPGDIIKISEGLYKESLQIDKPLIIEGSAGGKTIVECNANEASILTINTNAKNTKVSGLTMKHKGLDLSEQRYAGVVIKSSGVTLKSSTIENAAGHGIAVIDAGNVIISFCKITGSGWDGISVYGKKTRAVISETLCEANYQHGIAFWNGGSGTAHKCYTLKNSFCGIAALSKGGEVQITKSICSSNRQAGIYISDAQHATLNANTCKENLHSGIVIKGEQTKASIASNTCTNNKEAGIGIHAGVLLQKLSGNQVSNNVSYQMVKDLK